MKKLGFGLTLLAVAGCSSVAHEEHTIELPEYVTINEEVAAQNGLVARAILPNQVVEWYEPADGILFMSEAGIATEDVRPVINEPGLQDMTPTELYEFLSDSPAPQALKEIEARAVGDLRLTAFTGIAPAERLTRSAPRAPKIQTSNFPTNGVGEKPGCPEDWFRWNFCDPGSYDVKWCTPDWWDGYYAHVYDLEYAYAGACSKSGTISVGATFSCSRGSNGDWLPCKGGYGSWGSYSLGAGTYRFFSRTADYGGPLNFDREFFMNFRVTNAIGDNFATFVNARKD